MTRVTVNRKKTAYLSTKKKGYFGMSKGIRRMSIQRIEKGWQYATEHRRKKSSIHRSIWIQRINAAVREHNLSYSKFMHTLKIENIHLNRKILAEIAVFEPFSFISLVTLVQKRLNQEKIIL